MAIKDHLRVGVRRLRKAAEALAEMVRFLRIRSTRRAAGKAAPTFVVGSSNTGTTILRAIVGTSPDVIALDYESTLFAGLPDGAGPRSWRRWLGSKPFLEMADWEQQVIHHPRAVKLIEKTPTHIRSVGHLLRWWPRARVVVVVRNPLDTAVSWKRRGWTAAAGAQRWADDYRAVLPHLEDPRVQTIAYEWFADDLDHALQVLWEAADVEAGDPDDRSSATVTVRGPAVDDDHVQRRRQQVAGPLQFTVGDWRSALDDHEVHAVVEATRAVHGALSDAIGRLPDIEGNSSP